MNRWLCPIFTSHYKVCHEKWVIMGFYCLIHLVNYDHAQRTRNFFHYCVSWLTDCSWAWKVVHGNAVHYFFLHTKSKMTVQQSKEQSWIPFKSTSWSSDVIPLHQSHKTKGRKNYNCKLWLQKCLALLKLLGCKSNYFYFAWFMTSRMLFLSDIFGPLCWKC